ncbi:bifunctional 4-hydroxy-2-oxoglutarate aldolase/2-dehydro-3-deoxy-phosphogluconate aldolase [Gorillibacterium massiliense]|uniref:bifunctional 4-hydroxy-2-oxoglutarate aldolase/2-dehydro-3-deoxy-phosphogluconate aldolase n=1 Tax=Gorillibacterium massiliense TaxID=1280390 RepID=UPI0004ADD0BC|nr:bifunctional 4-hydroxy-2-oxoglutarate aldolase/2-dehydro-3-deoxy-phosphogluconate aldolase [Gorillibacterium massiliense]
MNKEQGLAQIERTRIIAIVRGVDAKDILPLAEALLEGGVTVMEVTMNTKNAPSMIAGLQKEFGGQMYIGAGTVLNTEDAKRAREAGADFFVMPHADEDVIQFALHDDLPVFPGAMTPTEVYKAWQTGATAVKIFPSTGLGPAYIKEIRGPFGMIPIIAVGGVTEHNIVDYLQAGCFAVGIGGSVIHQEEIRQGQFDKITGRARTLTTVVQAFRRE